MEKSIDALSIPTSKQRPPSALPIELPVLLTIENGFKQKNSCWVCTVCYTLQTRHVRIRLQQFNFDSAKWNNINPICLTSHLVCYKIPLCRHRTPNYWCPRLSDDIPSSYVPNFYRFHIHNKQLMVHLIQTSSKNTRHIINTPFLCSLWKSDKKPGLKRLWSR